MKKLSPGNQGDSLKGTEMSVSISAFLLQEDVSWSNFHHRLRSLGGLEQESSERAMSERGTNSIPSTQHEHTCMGWMMA